MYRHTHTHIHTQVISQLGELQRAADIQDVSQVAGMTVGVLASSPNSTLSTLFAFNAKVYKTMSEATAALEKKDINALLMPHANVLNHFRGKFACMRMCLSMCVFAFYDMRICTILDRGFFWRVNVFLARKHSACAVNGFDARPCGNPLKIVGSPLMQDNAKISTHTILCACDTCNFPQVSARFVCVCIYMYVCVSACMYVYVCMCVVYACMYVCVFIS